MRNRRGGLFLSGSLGFYPAPSTSTRLPVEAR